MDKAPGTSSIDDFLPTLRREDRDRYLTIILLGDRVRAALCALAMYNLELARIADTAREPTLGLIRLQWWRQEIAELGSANAKHSPLLAALARLSAANRLNVAWLEQMIDAREPELDTIAFPDQAVFEAHADRSAGNLVRAWLSVVGADEIEPMQEPIAAIATAYAMVGRLRSAKRDAMAGRIRLPFSAIERAGLSKGGFLQAMSGEKAAADRGMIARMAAQLAERAEENLSKARSFRWPAAALPAILTARLARLYLRRMRARGFDIADELAIAAHPSDIWELLWSKAIKKF